MQALEYGEIKNMGDKAAMFKCAMLVRFFFFMANNNSDT